MSIRKGQYFIAGMPDNSSGNYVTIDTTQTITATKTFSGGILATGGLLANDTLGIETNFGGLSSIFSKKNATQIGTPPQDIESTASYTMLDKDGNTIAQYTSSYNTDGSTSSGLRAYSPSNNGNHADVTVYYPASGMPTTYCVTPQATTETLNGEIATCGWVNSTTNNVVHKTGNETITGSKTFTSYQYIKNVDCSIANPPASTSWKYIDCIDSNGVRIGVIGSQINTDGTRGVYLQAGNEGNISIFTNGTTAYTSTVTPPASDNSTKIATTAWVRSNGVIAASFYSSNGYVKFNHGLIIQWGIATTANATYNFSTPFSSDTSYSIAFGLNFAGDSYSPTFKDRNKSSFTYYCIQNRHSTWIAVGY